MQKYPNSPPAKKITPKFHSPLTNPKLKKESNPPRPSLPVYP